MDPETALATPWPPIISAGLLCHNVHRLLHWRPAVQHNREHIAIQWSDCQNRGDCEQRTEWLSDAALVSSSWEGHFEVAIHL